MAVMRRNLPATEEYIKALEKRKSEARPQTSISLPIIIPTRPRQPAAKNRPDRDIPNANDDNTTPASGAARGTGNIIHNSATDDNNAESARSLAEIEDVIEIAIEFADATHQQTSYTSSNTDKEVSDEGLVRAPRKQRRKKAPPLPSDRVLRSQRPAQEPNPEQAIEVKLEQTSTEEEDAEDGREGRERGGEVRRRKIPKRRGAITSAFCAITNAEKPAPEHRENRPPTANMPSTDSATVEAPPRASVTPTGLPHTDTLGSAQPSTSRGRPSVCPNRNSFYGDWLMTSSPPPSQRASDAEASAQLPDVANTEDTNEWLQHGSAQDEERFAGKGKKGKDSRVKGKSGSKTTSGEEGTRHGDTARYDDSTGSCDDEIQHQNRQFQLGTIFRVRYLVTYTSGVTELLDEDPRK